MKYTHSPLPGPQPSFDSRPNAAVLHFYESPDPRAKSRPAILCIPSLINRHYILDLRPGASLVRHLGQLGFDAWLLEWPLPTPADSTKTAEDYVVNLLALLQTEWHRIDRPLIALGYCMGGLLALALAQCFERVRGLVLLATPWDYGEYPLAKLTPEQRALLERWIEAEPLFPAEALQLLLYLTDPYRLYLRFSRFALETRPEVAESFVALEHWANDSIPITQGLARESLLEWPRENRVARGEWRVGRELILPQSLKIPAFVATPTQDHIVPSPVSAPLAALLPRATAISPQAGHVGMIAGMQRMQLWEPLGGWLASHFGAT